VKVLVFGAGALGSLVGGHLARRFNVHLVGRDPHMATVARQGLQVVGARSFTVACEASTAPRPHWVPDLVIIAVKAYDRQAAIEALAPLLGPRTAVVTLQNGLGNWEAYGDAFAGKTVLAASIVYGAALEAPGRVRATGKPAVTIGGSPADVEAARAVAEAFDLADLPTGVVEDVRGTLLAKALVNAVINPLTALARVPNGRLLVDAGLTTRFDALAAEGQALMDAAPYDVPVKDLRARAAQVASITAENRSSMLQDVERGRRTEIDAITGQLLALADAWGVRLPTHERMLEEMHALESAPSTATRRAP
jgi:2-dehydropantoate 2-reductase